MNEKLKKGLKVGGIVLGLLAYGLCAFGVGACSRKPVTMVKAESSQGYPDSPDEDMGEWDSNDYLNFDFRETANGWINFDFENNALAYSLRGGGSSWNTDYRPVAHPSSVSGALGLEVTAGWYYYNSDPENTGNDARLFACENYTAFESIYQTGGSGTFNSFGSWYVYLDHSGYFYLPSPSAFFWAGLGSVFKASVTKSDTWEVLETMYLPSDWSPLGMVGSNINAQSNMLFDTPWLDASWQTPIPRDSNDIPYLPLKGMFFRNQGQLFNRIIIEFDNLNGKDYTPDGVNVLNGTTSDWYVSAVRYQLVNGNGEIMQNYLAGSPRYVNKGSDMVLALGIKWTIPSAQKLDILVRNTYTYPFQWANDRFYARGVYTTDPDTGERVKPIGYYLNDYEFLLAYSDVTSYPVTSLQGSGVFDLLSSGFGSMLPILNIAILPGITFGLLMFLPIIAGIIVIIIKVIKK